MRQFKDSADRTWELSVTVGTIRRVRDLVHVDLMELIGGDEGGNPELLTRLAADPVLLVDVLYAICKPQCDQAGVSDVEFGESLLGDAIDHATTALLEAIVDFFPSGRRPALTTILERAKTVDQMLTERLNQAAETMDPAEVVDSLLMMPGGSSGVSPARSVAIPAI